MDASPTVEYKKLKISGPVSVERVASVQEGFSWKVLIMGPMGSGKSTFIEALGLQGTTKISSNGLDGCTQTVNAYKLNNATIGGDNPVYFVDSPGFADTKISELAIVLMLQKWLKDNDTAFHRILFLMPATCVRLPGSQRRALKTFQALTGVESASAITIVTTMWDTIWGEQAEKRAEDTYMQLQSDVWKDFIDDGAQIARFYNTKESALSILDAGFHVIAATIFNMERDDNSAEIKDSPFAVNIYTDLHNRIQNLNTSIATLHDDLAHTEALGDELLQLVLHSKLDEAKGDLIRFQQELDNLGPAPIPLASASIEEENSPPEKADLQVEEHNTSGAREVQTTQQRETVQRNPGRLVRAMKLMKCWGDAVGQRQED
ncbi:hypothetical protein BJ165DRAFT_1611816 [Panaeolus papilionaceus]|nr:hypothetical protein BJ165DRAFT_1611816 [Panaeolus papilionaceus]